MAIDTPGAEATVPAQAGVIIRVPGTTSTRPARRRGVIRDAEGPQSVGQHRDRQPTGHEPDGERKQANVRAPVAGYPFQPTPPTGWRAR